MRDPINELISLIKETQQEIATTVAAGHGVNSFETYQRLVGRHEGLQITLDLINDVLTGDEEESQDLRRIADMAIDFDKKAEPDTRSELECFPVVDPGIEVAGDRVLVQLRREKISSKGGIILVDETKQTLRFNETVAKVVQIGPLAYKSPDTMEPWPEGPWCNVGDLVRTIKYGGDRFVVDPDDGGAPVVFITVQAREVISRIKNFEFAQKMKAFVD